MGRREEQSEIIIGDCLKYMRGMEDCSVDAVVTDPPYGISFMGKKWDYDVPGEDVWRECLRVLKPGGYMLVACGTRTQHRMAVRIEDAGFEIRDVVLWVYGSGYPKSLDVSKAIDKADGHWRGRCGVASSGNLSMAGPNYERTPKGDPITDAARQWQGWGTALKPAVELWTLARKPLEGTVAANVLAHGTGAINIDGCRVPHRGARAEALGRFPANFIHDGSNEVLELFPDAGGSAARFFMTCQMGDDEWLGQNLRPLSARIEPPNLSPKNVAISTAQSDAVTSASRLMYCAKASKWERDMGLEFGNDHPTVKPFNLMRYLCRLITPPGGLVLDPFAGSGSTGIGAKLEGFQFLGVECDADYAEIAKARIASIKTANRVKDENDGQA